MPQLGEETVEDELPLTLSSNLNMFLNTQNFSGAALVSTPAGFVLNQGYGLVERQGSNEINTDTVFRLGSITKQFTATSIMLLQQDGLLNVDDTVATHLPDYPNGDRITIRYLLNHLSGIPDYTALPDYFNFSQDFHSPADLLERFANLPLNFEPGTQYRYTNSGYALLGALIEEISNQSYAEFVSQRIFLPLGMSDSGYGDDRLGIDNRAQGYLPNGSVARTIDISVPYSAGALVSTAMDMFLWDQSFANNTLLTQESQRQMFTPNLENYGFGWVVLGTEDNPVYEHGGVVDGFTSFIRRLPSQGVVIILLSNEQIGTDIEALVDGIEARL